MSSDKTSTVNLILSKTTCQKWRNGKSGDRREAKQEGVKANGPKQTIEKKI